jgi:hypothetical protein
VELTVAGFGELALPDLLSLECENCAKRAYRLPYDNENDILVTDESLQFVHETIGYSFLRTLFESACTAHKPLPTSVS